MKKSIRAREPLSQSEINQLKVMLEMGADNPRIRWDFAQNPARRAIFEKAGYRIFLPKEEYTVRTFKVTRRLSNTVTVLAKQHELHLQSVMDDALKMWVQKIKNVQLENS